MPIKLIMMRTITITMITIIIIIIVIIMIVMIETPLDLYDCFLGGFYIDCQALTRIDEHARVISRSAITSITETPPDINISLYFLGGRLSNFSIILLILKKALYSYTLSMLTSPIELLLTRSS